MVFCIKYEFLRKNIYSGGGFVFYKIKRQDILNLKQQEDKDIRYDYGKVRVDVSSGLIGENEKIKDSR